jgi:hypothetical protein
MLINQGLLDLGVEVYNQGTKEGVNSLKKMNNLNIGIGILFNKSSFSLTLHQIIGGG